MGALEFFKARVGVGVGRDCDNGPADGNYDRLGGNMAIGALSASDGVGQALFVC